MSATPEEKALIKAALQWQRKANADTVAELLLACQAVRISRRPPEGPDPIPCSVKAMHSDSMICLLPRGHEGSEPTEYGATFHEGMAANGNGWRRFTVYLHHQSS